MISFWGPGSPRHDTSSLLVFGSLYRETQKTLFCVLLLVPHCTVSPNFTNINSQARSYRLVCHRQTSSQRSAGGNTAICSAALLTQAAPDFFLWSRHCGCRGCWQSRFEVWSRSPLFFPSVSYPSRFCWSTLSCKCERWFSNSFRERFCRAFGFLFSIPKHSYPGENLEPFGPRFRF